MSASPLAFLLADIDAIERTSRLRELRVLSLIFLGKSNPITIAFDKAIIDPGAANHALRLLDAAPALRRRRLLAAYQALMTGGAS